MIPVKSNLADYRRIKTDYNLCISCGTCADSCFYYRHEPCVQNIPAYKMRTVLKPLIKKKITKTSDINDIYYNLIWERCVLCGRCYCPIGIDIPFLLSQARMILRENGIYEDYAKNGNCL